jgi:hypothetical protein
MSTNHHDFEVVDTCSPSEHESAAVGPTSKPILKNYRTMERQELKLDPLSIVEKITTHTSGWPKLIGGKLMVISRSGELRNIDTTNMLFAFLQEQFEVYWKNSQITKEEFFELLKTAVERKAFASELPHFPPIEDAYYHHQPVPEQSEQKLEEFIDRFFPATPLDRDLIKSLIMTTFWGGEPGQRPSYLISSDASAGEQGRGVGKSTLLTLIAELCGGEIRFSQNLSHENCIKRIINQAGERMGQRIISIDNVKSSQFSNSDHEAMITAREIQGNLNYKGNSSVPNYFTFVLTMNRAKLSKDLANRSIVIQLGTPNYTGAWYEETLHFIHEHKWKIIAGIKECLAKPGTPLDCSNLLRWASWEQGVLSKLENYHDLKNLIKVRQGEIDGESECSTGFYDFLREKCFSGSTSDQFVLFKPGVFRCTNNQMQQFVSIFLGKNIGRNAVTRTIESYNLKCLRNRRPNGSAGVWFFKENGSAIQPQDLQTVQENHQDSDPYSYF